MFIVIILIIIILILVAFLLSTAKTIESEFRKKFINESFSPIGCEPLDLSGTSLLGAGSLYHYFKTNFDGQFMNGSCGPGCVYRCKDPNCPNAKTKKYSPFFKQIKEPKALPVGANNDMSLFFDNDNFNQCTGTDGTWYPSGKNPYGFEMPKGKQMYSFCSVNPKV
jgi:hypothetical protein